MYVGRKPDIMRLLTGAVGVVRSTFICGDLVACWQRMFKYFVEIDFGVLVVGIFFYCALA